MTESPLLHTSDSVAPVSPNLVSEPLSHTQRRAVLVVTVMAIFIALACGVAGYVIGFREGLHQSNANTGPTHSSPLYPLPVSPLPSVGDGQTACTLEAKLCADGSSVGRSGPNCEFTPCPNEVNPQAPTTYGNQ